MKFLIVITILTCCLLGTSYSQSLLKDSTYSNSCNIKYCYCDSIVFNNETLKYFIVSKRHWYRDQNNYHFYRGEIILYVEKEKYKKKEFQKIFLELSEKHNLAAFIVFNTCKAYEFSVSAMGEPQAYKGYVVDHYLGSFDKPKKGKLK
jgi:hypothetical protein